MKIRDYIGIYPNMVPLNLCDDIIGFFEQNSQFLKWRLEKSNYQK